jgi:hypothetical protein
MSDTVLFGHRHSLCVDLQRSSVTLRLWAEQLWPKGNFGQSSDGAPRTCDAGQSATDRRDASGVRGAGAPEQESAFAAMARMHPMR